MSRKRKNHFGSRCEGEHGVAGEGRVVGLPKLLRLDVQRFLSVCIILGYISYIIYLHRSFN